MANKELITCDYAGCDLPFAYRIKGFNLCSAHCFERGYMDAILDIMKFSIYPPGSSKKFRDELDGTVPPVVG